MFRVISIAVLLVTGCVGEAYVSFQGTVIEGVVTAHAFESAPATGTPVVGATVDLCFGTCSASAATAITASDGSYAELGTVFGGMVGVDTHIEVRVTALDSRAASYAITYEHTDDPTIANPEGSNPVFLNFSLAPP